MRFPGLPICPDASALVAQNAGPATVEWYNYWRNLGDAMRRSLEAEARYYQLKAVTLDPRTYVFASTDSSDLVVPAGETYLSTNLYRMRFDGITEEAFQRKADALDFFLLPGGTTFDATPHHATIQYCAPSIVTDPASTDYDARYINDPKGLYFERLRKLETLPLRTTSATIASGTTPFGQVDQNLNWGTLTEQWGIVRFVSLENGSWMLAIDDSDVGVNLVREISDDHAHRLQAFPMLMPFLKTQFTKIRMRGGSKSGSSSADAQFDNASGVMIWSALDEATW